MKYMQYRYCCCFLCRLVFSCDMSQPNSFLHELAVRCTTRLRWHSVCCGRPPSAGVLGRSALVGQEQRHSTSCMYSGCKLYDTTVYCVTVVL